MSFGPTQLGSTLVLALAREEAKSGVTKLCYDKDLFKVSILKICWNKNSTTVITI